jgi:uroporphyrinogen-III synthase
MRVLVTREPEAAAATAARLTAAGHTPVIAPLTRIVALPAPEFSGAWDAVLLTSPAAVRCLEARPEAGWLAALPMLAVGDRTADAARSAGFADVRSAAGDGEDLVRLAAAALPGGGRVLHPAALQRARDYDQELGRAGIAVVTVPIYEARAVAALPETAVQPLRRGEIDAVLHFSQRSSVSYLHLAQRAGLLAEALVPHQLCLSARIAAPLAAAPSVRIAATPDEEALLALLAGSAPLVRRCPTG